MAEHQAKTFRAEVALGDGVHQLGDVTWVLDNSIHRHASLDDGHETRGLLLGADGQARGTWSVRELPEMIAQIRQEWATEGVVCHFCGDPCFAWWTDDESWAEVEVVLGEQQACFTCFAAVRQALGLDEGEPLLVAPSQYDLVNVALATDTNPRFVRGRKRYPRARAGE